LQTVDAPQWSPHSDWQAVWSLRTQPVTSVPSEHTQCACVALKAAHELLVVDPPDALLVDPLLIPLMQVCCAF
jgi:hypothetical protein